MSREAELVETWSIHNRIHLYLLADIDPAHLGDRTGGKGRSVGEQFTHVHNVA
jgi:hypothetical protein